jgi:hypothetical protein
VALSGAITHLVTSHVCKCTLKQRESRLVTNPVGDMQMTVCCVFQIGYKHRHTRAAATTTMQIEKRALCMLHGNKSAGACMHTVTYQRAIAAEEAHTLHFNETNSDACYTARRVHTCSAERREENVNSWNGDAEMEQQLHSKFMLIRPGRDQLLCYVCERAPLRLIIYLFTREMNSIGLSSAWMQQIEDGNGHSSFCNRVMS